jgi:O-antigen/teichoic acid export membrane protein
VRSGVSWNAASAILNYAVGLGRSILLARLLSPDDFGLLGMAGTILVALSVITNMGLDASIIINRLPPDEELPAYLNTIWTTEIIRRVFLTLLLLAASGAAVKFYGDPRLYLIVPVLALPQLIQGLQNIGLVILRKRLSFARLVWYEQASNIFATLSVVCLAFWLRNVWALVLSQVLSAVFSVSLSYVFHPYRPRLAFEKKSFRQAFNFGKYMFVVALMSYITTMADNVVLGKLWGAAILGVYVVAYNLASLPVGIISGVLNSVITPAYAELGAHDPERLGGAFARVYLISSAILLCITVPFILLGDEIVLLLYGARWAAAGSLLRILALVGFWRGLLQAVVPLLLTIRGPALEAKAKLVEALIFLSLLYPLTRNYGARGAAWAGVIIYLITMLNRFRFIKALAPQAFQRIPRIVLHSLGAGALGLLSGALVLRVIDAMLPRLITGSFVSLSAVMAFMLWAQPELRSELGLARHRKTVD